MSILRIHAHIEAISEPFDNGQWVEMKLKFDHRDPLQGECRIRIWSWNASCYRVGMELCGVFKIIGDADE